MKAGKRHWHKARRMYPGTANLIANYIEVNSKRIAEHVRKNDEVLVLLKGMK